MTMAIPTRVELEELYENCGKSQLNSALQKRRQAEQQATDAAVAEFEEGLEQAA